MKQLTAVLLCLLLWGCARQVPASTPEIQAETEALTAMAGMYDPDHPMEKAYPGLVRAYPLTLRKVHGIRALGKDVLVFSGQGSTRLTLLSGENLQEKAGTALDFLLQQEDPSLQIGKHGISYFDPQQQETVVLDAQLRELRRIAAPDGLSGKPILSEDGGTLYYCTGWSVVAWDLKTGIRRTLKELSYEAQELEALHLDGQILECRIQDHGQISCIFLSADQGLEIQALPQEARINTSGTAYFAAIPAGYQTLLLFGTTEGSAKLLLPKELPENQFYLPEDHSAVTVCSTETETCLDYYELGTGLLRASLALDPLQTPKNIVNTQDHQVYILVYDPQTDADILYRWDVLRQPPDPANVTAYTSEYRTADNPDPDTLAECREAAKAIGEKYGITVRIWEDATEVQPWDYQFTPEHLAPVLQKELKLLDERLAQYPEGVLAQTKSHFAGLTICLVRQISGTGDSRSLSNATGIQFFEENQAYVVITTGKYSQQALYHELFHVMETHILTESTALDQWESLNPAGFAYGSNQEEAEIYLQGQTRAFVDRYSMGYPKEDRARVLENAMLPEKETVFQSEYMQRKLTALCLGIREAYGLKKHPNPLPWEQYLINSLTPDS